MSEIDYRAKALSAIAYELALHDTGTYFKSVVDKDGNERKRTEWQEGWNACQKDILDKAIVVEENINNVDPYIQNLILQDHIFTHIDTEEKKLCFSINCNDLFAWACADSEEFTEEDLPDLKKAYEDSPKNGDILWACRKREMRPQKPYYKYFSKEEKKLFDACGEPRDD